MSIYHKHTLLLSLLSLNDFKESVSLIDASRALFPKGQSLTDKPFRRLPVRQPSSSQPREFLEDLLVLAEEPIQGLLHLWGEIVGLILHPILLTLRLAHCSPPKTPRKK